MQFRGKFHPHLDSYPRHHINQNQRLAKKRHLLVAFMIQGAWELRNNSEKQSLHRSHQIPPQSPSRPPPTESEDHDRFSTSSHCHALLHPIALTVKRVLTISLALSPMVPDRRLQESGRFSCGHCWSALPPYYASASSIPHRRSGACSSLPTMPTVTASTVAWPRAPSAARRQPTPIASRTNSPRPCPTARSTATTLPAPFRPAVPAAAGAVNATSLPSSAIADRGRSEQFHC